MSSDDHDTGPVPEDDTGSVSGKEDDDTEGNRGADQALRDLLKGAGTIYTGLITEVIIAFLAQVLAARYLSVGGFGGVTTGTAVLNLGAILSSLGLGRGLTRYLPRVADSEKSAIAWRALLFGGGLSIVVAVTVVGAAELVVGQLLGGNADIVRTVTIFGAAIPAATVLSISIGGIRGQKRSRYRVYVENVLRPTSRFVLVATAIAYGLGEVGIAGAYTLPYVFGAIAAIFLFRRTLPSGEGTQNGETVDTGEDGGAQSTDRTPFRSILRYSIPFVVSRGTGFIYRSIDIFLVLYFLDSTAVGTYGVAYAAARLILMFSTAFNYLGAPVASELDADGDDEGMVRMHYMMLRWLVVVSIPALVPFVLFPETFITAIYRSRYAAGASALAALAVGFAVHNVLSAQTNLLQARGESDVLALNSALSAITNVLLNLILVPRYGIFGAAIATVAAYLVIDGLLAVEFYRILDRWPLPKPVVAPAVVALPPFVGLAVVRPAIPETLPWIVLTSGVFTVVYSVLTLVTLGVRTEELMLLRSVEERFEVDLGPIVRLAERLARS
jgi:O-antigen/teichoic acid export membrane protein